MRAFPGIGLHLRGEMIGSLVLAMFRGILVAGAAGNAQSAAEMRALGFVAVDGKAALTCKTSAEPIFAAQAVRAAIAAASNHTTSAADAAVARTASAATTASAERSSTSAVSTISASANAASARSGSAASSAAARSAASIASHALPIALDAFSNDVSADGKWNSLWPDGQMPKGIDEAWQSLKLHLEVEPKAWGFWLEWYQGLIKGEPLDWRLIHRIALEVTNKQWEVGPVRVADQIREIRTHFDLQCLISDLEALRGAFLTSQKRHGIGGNNPPEDMQIEPQVVRETTIIWAAVDELKAETDKEAPDRSTVLRVIETLGQALKAILAWCAQKGDLSVDTLIKWGIPIGGAAVLANPKLVSDVIEAAKAWVPFLP